MYELADMPGVARAKIGRYISSFTNILKRCSLLFLKKSGGAPATSKMVGKWYHIKILKNVGGPPWGPSRASP